MALSKCYIGFLDNNQVGLMDALSEFHSANVNPLTLTVSGCFSQVRFTEEALKNCPQVRLYLVQSQYSKEKTRVSAAGPVISQFFDHNQIIGRCKKPGDAVELETMLRAWK